MGLDLYWIGTSATDDWNDPTKWSQNPNGSSANVVPTRDDNVFFLNYSPSTTVVNLSGSGYCKDFTIQSFQGLFTWTLNSARVYMDGSLNWWTTLNNLSSFFIYMRGQNATINTLNPADSGNYFLPTQMRLRMGIDENSFPLTYTPTYTFTSYISFLCADVSIYSGNIYFTTGAAIGNAAFPCTFYLFDQPTVYLGSGTFTIQNGSSFGFQTPSNTGVINGGTSTFEITGNDNAGAYLIGNEKSYFYNVKITSSGGTSTTPSGPTFRNVNIKNLLISTRTAKSTVIRVSNLYWLIINRVSIPTTSTTPLILGSSSAIQSGTVVFTRKIGVGNCTYTANASACIEKWDGTEGDENYISYLTVNRIQVSSTATDFNFFQNP